MALPIPNGQNRQPKPADSEASKEEQGLPTLPPMPQRSQPLPTSTPEVSEVPRPTKKPAPPAPKPEPVVPKGYAVDEETGITYRKLPKSEYDSNGNPVLQIQDFDADDLNAEAESFLGHLRVAPSKEEILQLREERARKMRARQQS